MADNLHVAIRVRPLITREAGSKSNWKYDKKSICLIGNPKPYIFDRVFAHDEYTADVYREIAQPIVQAAMNGYDGTIFAYGQTSSGKTFTMMGDDKQPGIITKAVHELFEIIENTPEREFLFRVSYMELYNEVITDLLSREEKGQLIIRENEQKRVFVSGLTETVVTNADAVFDVMKKGNARRHVGKTNMNEYSSRSHTIFKVTIESCEAETEDERDVDLDRDLAVKLSELNLVDLAGSERANETKAEGVRLKEAGNINRSLFTLCNVISRLSALADFIPFRDSKLTRILQSALGGNSKTAVICTVTPVSIEQTDSTLQFASRAKTIQTKPEINEILTGEAQIQRCQKEIKSLKAQLEFYQQGQPLQDQDRIARLEEEKMAQQEKINVLQSKILVSKAKPEESLAVKKKRRMTWCPGKMKRRFSRLGALDDSLVKLNPLPELEELRGLEVMSLPNESFRAGADFSFSSVIEPPEEFSPVTKRSKVVSWAADNISSASTATQTDPPEDDGDNTEDMEKDEPLQESIVICEGLLREKEEMEEQLIKSNQELMNLRQSISSLEYEKLELATTNENLKFSLEDALTTTDFNVNEKMVLEEFQNELTEQVDDLQKKLQEAQQSQAEAEIQLGSDNKRLERRVQELTTQLQQVYGDHSESSKEESEAVKENQRLTEAIEEIEKAFQVMKDELEEFKAYSAKQLEEMNCQKSKLEEDLVDARRNLESNEEELEKQLLSTESTECQLTEARQELQSKESQCEGFVDELKQRQQQLETAEENLTDAKTLLESKEQELELRADELENLRKEIEMGLGGKKEELMQLVEGREMESSRLVTVEEELDAMKTKLGNVELEYKLELDEVETAKEQLKELERKEQEWEKILSEHETERRRLEAVEEELTAARASLERDEELDQKLDGLAAANERLKADLGSAENEYKELIDDAEALNKKRVEACLAETQNELALREEELKNQSAELETVKERLVEVEGLLCREREEKNGGFGASDVVPVAFMESKVQERELCLEEMRREKEELGDLESRDSELRNKLDEVETEKLMLEAALEERERDVQGRIGEMEMQKKELEETLAEARRELAAREQELLQQQQNMEVMDSDQKSKLEVTERSAVVDGMPSLPSSSVPGGDDQQLQEMYRDVEAQNEQLKSELASKVLELQVNQEETHNQQEMVKSLESEVAELRREFQDREQKLIRQMEDLEAQMQVHEAGSSLDKLGRNEEEEMQSRLAEVKREFENREQELLKQIEDQDTERNKLQTQIEDLKRQRDELQELVESNEREMESWRTEADGQRKRLLESLESVVADSKAEFDVKEWEYRGKLEGKEREKTQLQELVERKEGEIESYRQKAQELEKQRNEIQADLEKEVDRETELVDLEIKIEELRGEKEDMAAKLEIKEQELEIALQEGNEMERQMTELMAERDQINKDLQESINCSIEAQEELVKTQGALEEALQNLQSVEERYEGLLASRDDNEHFTSTIVCLQQEKSDLEKALDDIQQTQLELNEQNKQQQQELAEKTEELEERLKLNEQNRLQQQELAKKNEELEEQLKLSERNRQHHQELPEENAEPEVQLKQNEENRQQLQELAERNGELENRLKELTEELDGLQGSRTSTAGNVQLELTDRITSLQQEKADLEKTVDDLEQKLQERQQDLQNHQRDIEEMTERNNELEVQLDELKESAEEQKERYELTAENDQLQQTNTISVLQKENNDLQQDVANIEQELQEHLREKEETQNQLDELIENNLDLENQLKEMTDEQDRIKSSSAGRFEELMATISGLQKEKSDLQQAGLALEQGLDELSGGNARSREQVEELSKRNMELEGELRELRQSTTSGAEKYSKLEAEKTAVEKKLRKIEQTAKARFELMMKNVKQAQALYHEALEKQEEAEGLLAERDRKIRELEQRVQSQGGLQGQSGTVERLRKTISELTQSNSNLEKQLKSSEEKATETFQQLLKKAKRAHELYVGELEAKEKATKIIREEKQKNTELMERLNQQKSHVIDTTNLGNMRKEELMDLVRDLQVELASNQRQIKQLDRIMEEAADPTAMGTGSGVVASATASHLRAHNCQLEKRNVEVEKQMKKAREQLRNERFKYAEMKEKKEYWKGQFSKAKLSQSSMSTAVSSPKKPLRDHNTPTPQHPVSVRTHPKIDYLASTSLERSEREASTSAASLTSESKSENLPASSKNKWLEDEFANLDDQTTDNCKQQ